MSLEADLKQLGGKVAALTKKVDGLHLETPAVAEQRRRVGKLESRINQLDARVEADLLLPRVIQLETQANEEQQGNEKKFKKINTKLDLVTTSQFGVSDATGGGRKKSKRKSNRRKSKRKSRRKSTRRKSKKRRVSKRRRR